MGLDVTAYSRLKSVGRHTEEWCDDYDNHIRAFAYADFPHSFRGIPILGDSIGGSRAEFIDGGCFERTAETQEHDFRAGSYSGYNQWRRWLSEQALGVAPDVVWDAADEYRDRPFFELIHFADNEGSIGPEAALDLLADFDLHVNLLTTPEEPEWDRDWWRRKYEDWRTAFRLAADGGLVWFHWWPATRSLYAASPAR